MNNSCNINLSNKLGAVSPKVSIIVPVYNAGRYLLPCIESILKQTYLNFEAILVDDGSTDGSGSLCEEYACRDPRLNVVHKANGGLSSARNAGIASSSGEYYFFLDADDLIDFRTIEYLVSLAVSTDSDIVTLQLARISPITVFQGDLNVQFYCTSGPSALRRMLLLDGETGSACGKLIRASLFEGVQFPVGRLFEDAGVTATLFTKCSKVCVSSSRLYAYVVRDGSITVRREYTSKHVADAEKTLSDMKHAALKCGLNREYLLAEGYSRVRVAAKVNLSYLNEDEQGKAYLRAAKRSAWMAAVSPLGSLTWRLRCLLFSFCPTVYRRALRTFENNRIR